MQPKHRRRQHPNTDPINTLIDLAKRMDRELRFRGVSLRELYERAGCGDAATIDEYIEELEKKNDCAMLREFCVIRIAKARKRIEEAESRV